ncbi:MAG TPA: exodeoxyribonuclease VII small subunit [Clostridia bacterium]|jgi:exodeoxyribonuclease VII small subunit|nr:exodeoxyribonuclease VII small subunit [Clostridia bacterium]
MNKLENATTSNLSYETAVTRLEEVVRLLEEERMSLDRVLELYEEGSKLVKFCSKMLEQAELKIKILDQDFYETEAEDFNF